MDDEDKKTIKAISTILSIIFGILTFTPTLHRFYPTIIPDLFQVAVYIPTENKIITPPRYQLSNFVILSIGKIDADTYINGTITIIMRKSEYEPYSFILSDSQLYSFNQQNRYEPYTWELTNMNFTANFTINRAFNCPINLKVGDTSTYYIIASSYIVENITAQLTLKSSQDNPLYKAIVTIIFIISTIVAILSIIL